MMMTEYKPIAGKDDAFTLAETTVAAEHEIHAIQVRYPGVNLQERQAICRLEKWKPEERIPELSEDVRVSISALGQLVERNRKKPRQTHTDLQKLCESRKKDHELAADQLSSEEYWYQIACVMLKDFKSAKVEDKSQLNFRVISEAYSDFFGV